MPVFRLYLVMFFVIITKLMEYFEFLPGSMIMYLPLNNSEKIALTTSSQKAIRGKRFITFIFVNTMNYLHALKNKMFI